MASDPRAQHYVECSRCSKNAKYYCNTCTHHLCQNCKEKHSMDIASKNHDIVLYQDKKTSAPSVELCHIHPDLMYIMCCLQCEVPVCQNCIEQEHKTHTFCHIDVLYKSKKEDYQEQVSKIKNQLLPQCSALLEDVQADNVKENIANIKSAMESKAQVMKEIIDTVLAEKKDFLQGLEQSLIPKLQQEEKTMRSYVAYLENIVSEFEKYTSTNKQAGFILFETQNPISNMKEIPEFNTLLKPSFIDWEVSEEDISRMFGEIKESTQQPHVSKRKNYRNKQDCKQQ